MAKEQIALRDPTGVASLTYEWFEEIVESSLAETIAARAIEMEVGAVNVTRCKGCLSDDADDWGGAFTWLKSRLLDHQALPWGWAQNEDPFYVVFNHNPLHMPALPPEVITLDDREHWRQSLSYARSAISRSPLSHIEPIDAVARRLTQFNDSSSCPYCKRYFRNGAALRLHVVESHGVSE